jgi:8-oxo-dGTP pyrophosphatase MutT (NUDIX family)
MKNGRNLVGQDHIGIAVVYFCHDGHGRFIMDKRNRKTRDEHGLWEIGGGEVELHQEVLDTLKREIKEEYGTTVVSYEFLGYRDVHRTQRRKKTHWITLDFKVLVEPDKVTNAEPDKFDAVEWFTLQRVPNNVHSQFPAFLKLYKDRL